MRPTSGKTARLVIVVSGAIALSWLFLHYQQGELIKDVLLIIAGGGGVLSLQKLQRLPPADEHDEHRS